MLRFAGSGPMSREDTADDAVGKRRPLDDSYHQVKRSWDFLYNDIDQRGTDFSKYWCPAKLLLMGPGIMSDNRPNLKVRPENPSLSSRAIILRVCEIRSRVACVFETQRSRFGNPVVGSLRLLKSPVEL